MGRKVDLDDLADAQEVAHLLGLTHPNSVYLYQRRHKDMPRPVFERGPYRAKLWLKSEIASWARARSEGDIRQRSPLD